MQVPPVRQRVVEDQHEKAGVREAGDVVTGVRHAGRGPARDIVRTDRGDDAELVALSAEPDRGVQVATLAGANDPAA